MLEIAERRQAESRFEMMTGKEKTSCVTMGEIYLFEPFERISGVANFNANLRRMELRKMIIILPINFVDFSEYTRPGEIPSEKSKRLVQAVYCNCLHLKYIRAQIYSPEIFFTESIERDFELYSSLLRLNVNLPQIKANLQFSASLFKESVNRPDSLFKISGEWEMAKHFIVKNYK